MRCKCERARTLYKYYLKIRVFIIKSNEVVSNLLSLNVSDLIRCIDNFFIVLIEGYG